MGLQSDGTGIIGDRLALSYGSDFGTPTAITWYRDGVVLTSYGAGNSDLNNDGALWLDVTAARGVGTYKATVVADGETYVTNEIVITKAEEQAEILYFDMEDDYTDGTDVTYGTDDNNVVATVTLSKNYAGTFRLYKANDSKYRSALNRFSTSTAAPGNAIADYLNTATGTTAAGTALPLAIGANASVLTTDAATNYDALNLQSGANRAVGHINADGSVTYKFVATANTFTRGQDYVIAFDQTSILTDTPGTGIANVSDEATVPYVTTPAKIAVTKVARDNSPEVTFYDDNGDVLSWYGKTGNGATLTAAGIASAQIYKSTEKTNDPKASTVGVLATGVTNRNGDGLDSGVWSAPVGVVADNTAYWFAQVTTTKGIFAADAVTITSEAVQTATKAATMINLTEKATSSTDAAKTATVSFENLRTSGTVYVIRGFRQWNENTAQGSNPSTDKYSTAAGIYSAYTEGISEAIVGQTTVEAGTNSVDIANTISEWKPEQATKVARTGAETWWGNRYIAVFIPDDEENYGMVYTNDGVLNSNAKKNDDSLVAATTTDSQGLTISQAATSLAFNKNSTHGTIESAAGTANQGVLIVTDTTKFNATGNNEAGDFHANDQFGNRMESAKAATAVSSVEVVNKNITNAETASATWECDINGDVTIRVTVDSNNHTDANVDRGDGFKVTALGSVVEITNTINQPANAAAALGANHDPATWTVKVGSDTLCAPTTALANKGTEAMAIKNLPTTLTRQTASASTAISQTFDVKAIHDTTGINLAGATATATKKSGSGTAGAVTLDVTTPNNSILATTGAHGGDVYTIAIETVLGNKVSIELTTMAPVLTLAGTETINTNAGTATEITATIASVKDQYGVAAANVSTTELTKTETTPVTGTGTAVTKVEYGVTSGTLTITLTGTALKAADAAGVVQVTIGGQNIKFTLANGADGAFAWA